jgi:hypothetical protein
MRGSPTIHPALNHLDGVRNLAILQHAETSFEIDVALAVNNKRTEQSVETPLNGIVKSVTKPVLN